jgi:hypothetical protein
MLSLAIVFVVSLVGMTSRVINRGRFGRVASALLRSVYAVVVGLGGWSLAALLILSTMPTVPVNGELVVAFTMGVPIGLTVYLAWFDRDLSREAKITGLVAALGAALVGAWLGFRAADAILALITPLVGAVIGANLALISLDMVWNRAPGAAAEQAPVTTPGYNDAVAEAYHG